MPLSRDACKTRRTIQLSRKPASRHAELPDAAARRHSPLRSMRRVVMEAAQALPQDELQSQGQQQPSVLPSFQLRATSIVSFHSSCSSCPLTASLCALPIAAATGAPLRFACSTRHSCPPLPPHSFLLPAPFMRVEVYAAHARA